MRLSESFLSTYRKRGDVFPNLLSRSVYLSKYCRSGETWTDTVRRCVDANCDLDPTVETREREELFDAMWHMKITPPGRGLFTGGVTGVPNGARLNCFYYTLRKTSDWEWMANRLLEGGGVGVGLNEIHLLPQVQRNETARLTILCSKSHPNEIEFVTDEIVPNDSSNYTVPDSRQGWAEALRVVLDHAFDGKSICVNVSSIRSRGSEIKTFGGIAPGPGPLVTMLRNVWSVVRQRVGGKLTSVDCLDVSNMIGACIRSGGVRRSSIIQLGSVNDTEFRTAKHDWAKVASHRSSSNNSICFRTERELDNFDWRKLVDDCAEYGEPGAWSWWKASQTDPHVRGTNACAEACLDDYEACCLANAFPSRFAHSDDSSRLMRLITRYVIRQRFEPIEDPLGEERRRALMRVGVGLGGMCDFKWTKDDLTRLYTYVRKEANDYAVHLHVNTPTTVSLTKPDGTISSMVGTSSGVHAAYAPWYVRRIRIMDNEPMAGALIDANVPKERCIYDASGHTWVFEIPMRAHATAYTHTETISTQFKRSIDVQESWADQAVSTTLSFGPEEKNELVGLLEVYKKRFKSLSFLPRAHSYKQPPFERIEESEFFERAAKINMDHPLTYSDEAFEVDDCAGGVCPVR